VTAFEVNDAVSLVVNTYITIEDEEMLIKSISGNTITVIRGQDGSVTIPHVYGTSINVLNAADDELIPQDDDFGFSEYRYDYGDGKVYSPTKGIDV